MILGLGRRAWRMATGLIGLVILAAIFWVGWRYAALGNSQPHYHADFALYINGQREMFAQNFYYEEISACGADHQENPRSRVHLHDQEPGLIHVHDQAATWGHFLANLDWTLGHEILATDDGRHFLDGDNGRLRFILNGQQVRYVANRTISDQDILLIDFGNDSDQILQTRYDQIIPQASTANLEPDPASCGSGGQAQGWDRLKESFGL